MEMSFSKYIQHPWLGNYFLLHPVGGGHTLLVDGGHDLLVDGGHDFLVDGDHDLLAGLGAVQVVIQPTAGGHTASHQVQLEVFGQL